MRTKQTFSVAMAMLLIGTILGGSAQQLVSASVSSSSEILAFVPIEPCRLADSRPGSNNTGPRSGKLGAGTTQTYNAFDASTTCDGQIPLDATSVAMNVTALGATVQSFLTIWADGPRPNSSSLNPAPGEPPTPNAVTTALSSSGTFSIYNDAGETHVLVDVTGYYVGHDERVSNEIFISSTAFAYTTGTSGYPYFDSTLTGGGYPGVYLGGTDASFFSAQWTVGTTWAPTDQMTIGVQYTAHEDNLIDNPDGCSFVLYTSGATVFREGEAPMWVDAEFTDSVDSTPNEHAVAWEADEDGHSELDVALISLAGFTMGYGDQVWFDVGRLPTHVDDTCTDDMSAHSIRVTRSF